MSYSKPSYTLLVGDQGQRFEVRAYHAESGKAFVIGWTNEQDGGAPMRMARLWPMVRDPWVVDRAIQQQQDA